MFSSKYKVYLSFLLKVFNQEKAPLSFNTFYLTFYNFGIYCVAIIQGIQYIRNIIIPSVKRERGRDTVTPLINFRQKNIKN